jgi:hypothetical protein
MVEGNITFLGNHGKADEYFHLPGIRCLECLLIALALMHNITILFPTLHVKGHPSAMTSVTSKSAQNTLKYRG